MDKTIGSIDQETPLGNRIASVFVHVTDLRRSAEWYSRLLGLPLLEERLNGGPVYWLELPGTHLILDSNAANRQNPDWREADMPRVMFPASDIDQAYDYLQKKAETFFEPERHGTMAYFNFRDPEGNVHMACWTAQPSPDMELSAGSPIIARIGGVFVDVKDMKSSARWYRELLGLPLDEQTTAQSVCPVPVSQGASLLLDLHIHLKQKQVTEIFFFETDDFEASLAYVREEGFLPIHDPGRFENLTEFTLEDPDGNRILVCPMKR